MSTPEQQLADLTTSYGQQQIAITVLTDELTTAKNTITHMQQSFDARAAAVQVQIDTFGQEIARLGNLLNEAGQKYNELNQRVSQPNRDLQDTLIR